MLAELTLLAIMTTGQVCHGQYVGPPVYVQPAVHHHIVNQGVERSRQYVWVQLPDGHRTQIPVINGCLPGIKQHKHNGYTVRLTLDYRCQIAYNPKMYSGKYIVYRKSTDSCDRGSSGRAPAPKPDGQHGRQPTPAPVPDKQPEKAPAPKPPQDLRGSQEEGVGDQDEKKPDTPLVDPKLPDDVEPLDRRPGGVKPLSILPNPNEIVSPTRADIDFGDAFLGINPDDLTIDQNKMLRPSEIGNDAQIVPSYPRY